MNWWNPFSPRDHLIISRRQLLPRLLPSYLEPTRSTIVDRFIFLLLCHFPLGRDRPSPPCGFFAFLPFSFFSFIFHALLPYLPSGLSLLGPSWLQRLLFRFLSFSPCFFELAIHDGPSIPRVLNSLRFLLPIHIFESSSG